MDENIPIKLLKTISNEVTNKGKESRHQGISIHHVDD